jgi:hypothetical protein
MVLFAKLLGVFVKSDDSYYQGESEESGGGP